MSAPQADTKLARLLADAALQALFMRSRRQDLLDQGEGRKFVYGVDANVVRHWGNPRSHRANRYAHVGRIFRSDSDQLATATFWGLLSFIFERLAPEPCPLLLIPPIETELAAILEALHDSDPDVPNAAVRAELDKIHVRLSAHMSANELSKLNLKLQDLLLQEVGEHSELRRIMLLLTRSVVARLDDARANIPAALKEYLLPSRAVVNQWFDYGAAKSGMGRGATRVEGWIDRLTRIGTWRLDALMDHDAEVLARLEVWNRRLAENNEPWRILYVTADHRLFRAGALYFPVELEGRCFTEAYLRHPRAYLSEEGVLGPVDQTSGDEAAEPEESVGDWLALLTQPAKATFADLLDTSANNPDIPEAVQTFTLQLAQEREGQGQTMDHVAVELASKWQRFAQGALATNPIRPEALLGLTSDRLRSARELIRAIHDAHDRLEQDRRKVLRDYLRITTRLGRKFEGVQSQTPRIRSVAPVFFEEWRHANESIAIMSHWSDDHIDEKSYQNALDLIDTDDRTPYAFYLGNAAFFAARGRWRSAALVAKRARRIGLSFRTESSFAKEAEGAHGREAAYFEATCLRRLARERSALAAARECLAEAMGILAEEKQTTSYAEFVEERFPIEDALISLTAYFFEAFVESANMPHQGTFRSVADTLWELAELQEGRLSGLSADKEIRIGDVTDTRLRVEMDLLLTVISLAFLPDAVALDCYRARSALTRLEKRMKDGFVSENALSESDKAVLFAARVRDRLGHVDTRSRRGLAEALSAISKSSDLLPFEPALVDRLRSVSTAPWIKD